MTNDKSGGGYTFNTGVAQVKFISQVSNAAVKQYLHFRLKENQDNYNKLKSMLETFGLTITSRADSDDLTVLDHIIDNDNGDVSRIDVLKAIDSLPDNVDDVEIEQVRNVFIDIVQLMKKLNLDIPEKREVDPDDVV